MRQHRGIYMLGVFLLVLSFSVPCYAFSVYQAVPVTTADAFSSAQCSPISPVLDQSSTSPWSLNDNAIIFNSAAADSSSYIFGNSAWADCTVRVRLAIDDGEQSGLFLHYQNARNYYKVVFDRMAGSVSVVRMLEGEETVLDSVPEVVAPEYRIYVDFYQDEIAVFINGKSSMLVKDGSIANGKIGFFAHETRSASFVSPKVQCRVQKKSVLDHLSDIVGTSGDMIEFPVLVDAVRANDIMIRALTMPEGAAVVSGGFNWQPSDEQTGEYEVAIEAVSRDGKEREEKHIRVTVCDRIAAAQAINEIGEQIEQDAQAQADTEEQKKTTSETDTTKNQKKNSAKQQSVTAATQSEESAPTTSTSGLTSTAAVNYSGLSSPTVIYGGASLLRSSSSNSADDDETETNEDTTTDKDSSETDGQTTAIAPDVPVVNTLAAVQMTDTVTVSWSDESASGATVYKLDVSRNDALFASATEYWVTGTSRTVTMSYSDTYYFRVTAYTAQISAGGVASAASQTVSTVVYADKGLDVMMQYTTVGVFNDDASVSTSACQLVLSDTGSLGSAFKFQYDVREQMFTGLYFQDPVTVEHDISEFKTINYRIRTSDAENGPVRLVLELKYDNEVKGSVLITGITDTYTDHSFPLYCEGGKIDEITVLVLRDSDPDQQGTIYIDELFFDELDFVPQSPAVPSPDAETLSDAALLNKLEADMALYFYKETVGSAGFVKDNSKGNYASIASTGFGLAAMTILAERYNASDPLWNRVRPEEARSRAYKILANLVYIQEELQGGLSYSYGKAGCFYHFVDGDGKRVDTCEVSTVDTALVVMGALVAGEYFGDEVKELADRLAANIDWTFFLDRTTACFYMGWKPERAIDYTIYKDGGFLCDATYNTYTDEVFLISFLAMANHSQDADVAKSLFAFSRTSREYSLQTGQDEGTTLDIVPSYYGSLFTYIYAHCFVDFQTLGEDKPTGATGTSLTPVDWWQNSLNAIKANKDFCAARSEYFPFAFDNGNSWGISACQLPSGRYEGLLGAAPAVNGPHHDGTVAVTMPICALPFFKADEETGLQDNEAFKAIEYYYRHYKDELYGTYGFYGSYNDAGEFSSTYLGIDVGSALLMIENYRSRLIWKSVSANETMSAVFNTVFNEGLNYLSASVHTVGTDAVASGLSFGTSLTADTIASAGQYIRIDYSFKTANMGIAIYTDNTNNPTVPYTGTGNAAGLVGTVNATKTVPLLWTVFDAPQPTGYSFETLSSAAGVMQDASVTGFRAEDLLLERTLVNGSGELASYPLSARETTGSSIYVYLGADFRGASAQQYTTESITIEMYQLT